jgi:hypothetical protein
LKISSEERRAFAHAGTVRWDAASQALVWAWEPTVPSGYVVYLMMIDGDVKKGGIAKDGAASTFRKRMQSEFTTARRVILGPLPGKPLPKWRLRALDPFKTHAPAALLAGHVIELCAKTCPTRELMENEETRLNLKYRGEWTKEAWTRDGRRVWPSDE